MSQTYHVWETATEYKFRWGRRGKVMSVPKNTASQRQLTNLLARWAEQWYTSNPDTDPERNPDIAPD